MVLSKSYAEALWAKSIPYTSYNLRHSHNPQGGCTRIHFRQLQTRFQIELLVKIWEWPVIDQRVFPFGFSFSDYVDDGFSLSVKESPFNVAWRFKRRPGYLAANPKTIIPQALRKIPLEMINAKCI